MAEQMSTYQSWTQKDITRLQRIYANRKHGHLEAELKIAFPNRRPASCKRCASSLGLAPHFSWLSEDIKRLRDICHHHFETYLLPPV